MNKKMILLICLVLINGCSYSKISINRDENYCSHGTVNINFPEANGYLFVNGWGKGKINVNVEGNEDRLLLYRFIPKHGKDMSVGDIIEICENQYDSEGECCKCINPYWKIYAPCPTYDYKRYKQELKQSLIKGQGMISEPYLIFDNKTLDNLNLLKGSDQE